MALRMLSIVGEKAKSRKGDFQSLQDFFVLIIAPWFTERFTGAPQDDKEREGGRRRFRVNRFDLRRQGEPGVTRKNSYLGQKKG